MHEGMLRYYCHHGDGDSDSNSDSNSDRGFTEWRQKRVTAIARVDRRRGLDDSNKTRIDGPRTEAC